MRATFALELAAMEKHIGELLQEAVRAGELRAAVTPQLISAVLAAVEGTMLVWAIAPRGDIRARIREAVEVVLGLDGRQGAPLGPVLRSRPSRR